MQAEIPRSAPRETHLSPWRDVLVVAATTVGAAFLAAHYEINERVFAATRGWEDMQLDEWPIVVLVLAACLIWLSGRRYRQALTQLRARQAAEADLARALAANRELTAQHLRLQEAERRHLARELHDELGQYLNAIKIDAVALNDTTVDERDTRDAGERIVSAVNHIHRVVSDMIRRLRPAGLDELGLVAALENCVGQWQQRLPTLRFSLITTGRFDDLSELTNLTVYRLMQEGLTNVCKHAEAESVEIELRREDSDDLTLRISDNGRGADPKQPTAGFGLRGMRERVEMMGGHFTVKTHPGGGFAFEARLPAAAGE